MVSKDLIKGIIILILFIAGYLGYDFFQKEKTIVIYNQDNKSTTPTFYDISINTDLGPIKENLTLINPKGDIYGFNVTQNITFFKGFNDAVIIRNILLTGNFRYRIYDKNTQTLRYFINPNDVPLEKSNLNKTGDVFVKSLGTSYIENSFSVNVDLSTLRKKAQNNNFTNAILLISYNPELSLDVHIVDKNVKQTVSLNPVYYFYIDLDKAFNYE